MKKEILVLALVLLAGIANAQKKQNIYFLKNNGKEVSLKDSANYVRVIQEPDSGETNFGLIEYYLNGNRKTLGKVSTFEPHLAYEGVILRFDSAGKRQQITTYVKGMPLGMSFYYFNNGKMHKQIEYFPYAQPAVPMNLPPTIGGGALYNPNSKLIYYADSLGKIQVEHGNGHLMEVIKTPKGERIEEGDYKDGLKHGEWKGGDSSPESSFVETYEMGKLVNGESNKDGVKYPYTVKETFPEFKGGINKFYQHVGSTVRYPSDAVRNNISGTVIVEFTVERDGSLVEIAIKKSLYPSLDEEARRAIRFSPKWIPATLRGIPVRVRYTIPIKFSGIR